MSLIYSYSSQKEDESDIQDVPNITNTTEEERSKSKTNTSHVDLTFHDNGTQFTCKIYFAKEFDLMRVKTLKPPNTEKSLYKELEQKKKREELKVCQSRSGPEMELVHKPTSDINHPTQTDATKLNRNVLQTEIEKCRNCLARSLCSSVQWEARGGKSGSRFCKTLGKSEISHPYSIIALVRSFYGILSKKYDILKNSLSYGSFPRYTFQSAILAFLIEDLYNKIS